MGNRSSEFHPELRRVRREGSYIYEEFMPTGGTDVKVRYSLQCTWLYSTHIRKRICLSEFHVKLILLCCQPLQHTCKAPVCEGFRSCVQLVWLNCGLLSAGVHCWPWICPCRGSKVSCCGWCCHAKCWWKGGIQKVPIMLVTSTVQVHHSNDWSIIVFMGWLNLVPS